MRALCGLKAELNAARGNRRLRRGGRAPWGSVFVFLHVAIVIVSAIAGEVNGLDSDTLVLIDLVLSVLLVSIDGVVVDGDGLWVGTAGPTLEASAYIIPDVTSGHVDSSSCQCLEALGGWRALDQNSNDSVPRTVFFVEIFTQYPPRGQDCVAIEERLPEY